MCFESCVCVLFPCTHSQGTTAQWDFGLMWPKGGHHMHNVSIHIDRRIFLFHHTFVAFEAGFAVLHGATWDIEQGAFRTRTSIQRTNKYSYFRIEFKMNLNQSTFTPNATHRAHFFVRSPFDSTRMPATVAIWMQISMELTNEPLTLSKNFYVKIIFRHLPQFHVCTQRTFTFLMSHNI